jgi:hypothetical protein
MAVPLANFDDKTLLTNVALLIYTVDCKFQAGKNSVPLCNIFQRRNQLSSSHGEGNNIVCKRKHIKVIFIVNDPRKPLCSKSTSVKDCKICIRDNLMEKVSE